MLLPFNIGTASGCQTLERLAANAIMLSNAAAGPNGRPNSAAAAEVPAGYLRKGEKRRLGGVAHFLGCTGDSVCLSASRAALSHRFSTKPNPHVKNTIKKTVSILMRCPPF